MLSSKYSFYTVSEKHFNHITSLLALLKSIEVVGMKNFLLSGRVYNLLIKKYYAIRLQLWSQTFYGIIYANLI